MGASPDCADSARGHNPAAPQLSSAISSLKACEGRRRACHALVLGQCLSTKKTLLPTWEKGMVKTSAAFSAEGHREYGYRERISWLRSNATKSRGRWLSPSQDLRPSGDTRTFFSFTVAGPRRIHTGFPISRWLFSFQNEGHPSEPARGCQGRQWAMMNHGPSQGAAGVLTAGEVLASSRKWERRRSAASGLPSLVKRRIKRSVSSRSSWKARARAAFASRARPSSS